MFNPAPPRRSRDYVLPDPFASPVAVTAQSMAYVNSRGYYANNIEFALRDFRAMGLADDQLRSGYTYLLLQTLGQYAQPESLVVRRHAHQGGDSLSDMEFMRSLAFRESQRLRAEHDHLHPGTLYRQTIIVAPPHNRTNGLLPWFGHDSGFNYSFDTLLEFENMQVRMGKDKTAAFIVFAPDWHSVDAPPPRPFDMMEAIRASCGDARKSGQPAP